MSPKFLSTMLLLLLFTCSFGFFREYDVLAVDINDRIKRYLKSGETVTDIKELSFGTETLIIYYLSSGKFLCYSKERDSVIFGDEWLGIPNADKLAFQLLSLVAYDKYKPLKLVSASDFYEMMNYWNKGVEVGKKITGIEITKISLINLGAGLVLLILVPPAGSIATLLFFVGYGSGLANNLLDLISMFKIDEKTSPNLFLVLSLIPSRDQEAYENFKTALEKLGNPDFRKKMEEINRGVTFAGNMHDLSRFALIYAYSFLARNPQLISEIEAAVGRDVFEKALAFYLFEDDVSKFKEFSKLTRDVWVGSAKPGALNDFILKKATSTLSKAVIGFIIGAVKEQMIESSKDLRAFLGFHTSHSLLIRELCHDLANNVRDIKSFNKLPILENVQNVFYFQHLLYILLMEYDQGVIALNTTTLYKMYGEILDFWDVEPPPITPGQVTETWTSKVKGKFLFLALCHNMSAEDSLRSMLEYSSKVYEMFYDYKKDMATRRKGIPEEGGIAVFLVMDVSGSMEEEFRGSRKIDAAKSAAIDFISLLFAGDRAGIIKFSDEAEVVSELNNDKKALIEQVKRLEPQSATAIGDAIWLALDKLFNEGTDVPRAIILLTDGKHNAGVHTPIEAAQRASSMGIPVYTLGYGEREGIDENTLKEVARITNADYFYAPDSTKLRELYIRLSQQISGYVTNQILVERINKGETKVMTTTVSKGENYLGVKISYSGSKISLKLRSPSGINLSGYEGNVVYVEEEGYAEFSVHNPEVGTWTIYIEGEEVPQQGLDYRLVVLKPALTVDPGKIDLELRPGETVSVTIKIKALMPLNLIETTLVGNLAGIADITPRTIYNIEKDREILIYINIKAPESAGEFSYAGGIQIKAVNSIIFVPISVIINRIFVETSISSSILKPGETLQVMVRVLDIRGNEISGATVVLSNHKTYTLKEIDRGLYITHLAGLSEGNYTMNLIITKKGYREVQEKIYFSVSGIKLLGDVNNDGVVDYKDLAILIGVYGKSEKEPEFLPNADLDRNGIIDYKDLALLVSNYGSRG